MQRNATVIVVGGGLAGLSAAMEAAAAGANVTVLEKWDRLGGNSAKATSGINGWGTAQQLHAGVLDDSQASFEADTCLSGGGVGAGGGPFDPALVSTLASRSPDAIRWLADTFAVPLDVVAQLGGHSKPRTHRAPDLPDGRPVPIGFTIMKKMEEAVRKHPNIAVCTGARVVELITTKRAEGNRVSVGGVVYRVHNNKEGGEGGDERTVVRAEADATILATGGFSADRPQEGAEKSASLLAEFAPQLLAYPTTNGPFATGDGVKLARGVGAALVGMDKVQLHPTGLVDPKQPLEMTTFLGPEALRGAGGVLLNARGERFVNELDLRNKVSSAIIAQGDVYHGTPKTRFAYCVLNNAARALFGPGMLDFYWKVRGLFTYAEDVEALARIILAKGIVGGAPRSNANNADDSGAAVEQMKATLTATLSAYEAVSTAKTPCPLTGKTAFPCAVGPAGPFYVAAVTPTIHYTMGGALITPRAEVVSASSLTTSSDAVEGGIHRSSSGEEPIIHGLFGAGEVTGGVHGVNRLGGNSLLECVVFGRIAGAAAAKILDPSSSCRQRGA